MLSLRSAAAALSVCTLLAAGVPAATAAEVIHDPAGDTDRTTAPSAEQRRTVDIRRVTYDVRNGRLLITTRVTDLAKTPGNQFVETEVRTGGSTFTLSSEVGSSPVKIFTGSTLTTCRGATTHASFARDLVRQVVPVRCLGADMVRLKSSSVVAQRNGTAIVGDEARRSADVALNRATSARTA